MKSIDLVQKMAHNSYWMSTRIIKCARCGKEKRCHVSKTDARFCSRTCLAQWKRERAIAARPKPQRHPDGHYLVFLLDGRVAKISAEDIEAVAKLPWYTTKRGYAQNPGWNRPRRPIRLHRFICARRLGRELAPSEVVDHKNHDLLDNRRDNLRVGSQQQNSINRLAWKKIQSGRKGVYGTERPDIWQACLTVQGTRIYLGRFSNVDEAAWMYDQFALQLFGEYAHTNFDYK